MADCAPPGGRPPAVLLMGPTASGKTDLAVALADALPVDVISVDSAMVYRGMDIGTAKPGPDVLARCPHRLIDICDPAEAYSAGRFLADAAREVEEIVAKGRMPLFVGGTMMYFHVLTRGMAALPPADPATREELDARAAEEGWGALHAELQRVDPEASKRIDPADSQRIQRALEVFRVTGEPISTLQRRTAVPPLPLEFFEMALIPADRGVMRELIARRFSGMMAAGFLDEVRALAVRSDLTPELPSMRSVGYRQLLGYLRGDVSLDEAERQAVIATGQLAKRQLTWLRSRRGTTGMPECFDQGWTP